MLNKVRLWTCFCIVVSALSLGGQIRIDPFYTSALDRGQSQYQSGQYDEALKTLEIALFGLNPDPVLAARARALRALCLYRLGERTASEESLRAALTLREGKDISSLLPDDIAADLQNLLAVFRLGGDTPQETPEIKAKPRIPEAGNRPSAAHQDIPLVSDTAGSRSESLEQAIKAMPGRISLYYNLYDACLMENNPEGAEKTLERLIQRHPREVRGHYLLAVMRYRQRSYKASRKLLDKIITLSRTRQIDGGLLDEVKAYRILCPYNLRNIGQAEKLALEDPGLRSRIAALPLESLDKEKLESVFKGIEAEAAAESRKQTIEHLKTQIKANPTDIQRYYDLYEVYRQLADTKNARTVIKRLVKNNPQEMNAVFLLLKIEFLLEDYKEVLKNSRKILIASDNQSVSRKLTITSLIYASICYLRLDQRDNLLSFVRILFELSDAEELRGLAEEENLVESWQSVLDASGR
jgi:tetratricopeptide (TPR) repeat protein